MSSYQFSLNAMVCDEDKPHGSEGRMKLFYLRTTVQITTREDTVKVYHRYAGHLRADGGGNGNSAMTLYY